MLDGRPRLCFKVLPIPVLALLLIGYGLVHSVHVQAQVSHSNKVRELQEQRLATLRSLMKITTDRFKQGQASADEYWSATRAQEDAELALCTSTQERIAILERAVAEAKVLEEQQTMFVTNKLASVTSLLKATADRLQQEILLEQARGK